MPKKFSLVFWKIFFTTFYTHIMFLFLENVKFYFFYFLTAHFYDCVFKIFFLVIELEEEIRKQQIRMSEIVAEKDCEIEMTKYYKNLDKKLGGDI